TSAFADADVKTSFSGFGTLVGSFTDNDDVQVISTPFQTKGVDKDLDFGGDSRLGLQGRVEFGNAMSVTGQLIAQRRVSKDLDPEVEWLFGQWSGISGLDLRMGRVVLPAFMISDSRFVSYSLPSVRVPTLVYAMFPGSSVDGLQALYRRKIGPANWSFVGTYGSASTDTSETKDVTNLGVTAELGDWTFRYGYVQSKATITLDLAPGVLPLLPVDFKDKFHDLGVQYDNGTVFASAEYVVRKTEPKVLDSAGWYITGGARFGKWTPYATISRTTAADDNVSAAAFGPVILLKSVNEAKGLAAGVRYDVATNIALKAEVGHYKGASPFIFSVSDRTLRDVEAKVNMVSFGLDFVF
ncbi:MAG: porin, partial [Acetobacteraceae bacterium]